MGAIGDPGLSGNKGRKVRFSKPRRFWNLLLPKDVADSTSF